MIKYVWLAIGVGVVAVIAYRAVSRFAERTRRDSLIDDLIHNSGVREDGSRRKWRSADEGLLKQAIARHRESEKALLAVAAKRAIPIEEAEPCHTVQFRRSRG